MYFVYTLFCERDKNLYTGHTKDLNKRLKEHINGRVDSTKHRGIVKFIYGEICLNQFDALRREKYLKTGPGRKYIRNRLKYYFKNKFNKADGQLEVVE